jgi:predicted extracellular nuclease
VTSSEFYLQDPVNAGGTPFKQAIAVFTGKKPAVAAGDDVTVSGTVTEFFPDQSDTPSALNGFVTSIEKADPGAYVLLAGDLNSSGFSPAFAGLEARGALVDTERSPPAVQRYDYVFDGDSEELSGILASPALDRLATFAGPVHFNADFSGQASDHDPLLAYFTIPAAG